MTKIDMPSIAFIVARSYPQYIIGCENTLPWRLKTDLKHFKDTTKDHVVIMGRKTFESIGRPLPNRMNIVLSRNPGNDGNNLIWVNDRESALFFADFHSILMEKKQLFVVGGGEIYNIFEDLFNKIILTEVFSSFNHWDSKFEYAFDKRKWKTIDEKDYAKSDDDEFPFRISIINRRIKTVRQCEISDFLHDIKIHKNTVDEKLISKKIIKFGTLSEDQFKLPTIAA